MEAPAVRYPAVGRLLAGPRFVWVIVAIAILLGLVSLGNGLLADDLVHHAFLTAQRSGHSDASWWDMFVIVEHDPKRTIGMRTSGRYPWWVDPDLHIAFFRPLAVATHHLDHRLWPNSPALMHAHSVAWHVATCAMAWAVARRLVSSPRVAGLAGLIFTLSFTHVISWSWLAHRNGIISTFWALACLLAHIRWRSEGERAGAIAAPILLGAALLSAEAGVATLGFLLAYELVVSKDRARTRGLALVPGLAVVVTWQLIYDYLGYGAMGSGGYLDPIGEPLAFLLALPQRYGSLLALSVSAPFIPGAPLPLWIASAVGVALAALAFSCSSASKPGAARFGAVAVTLACMPLTASIPVERLLVLVSFAVALTCAELIDVWLLQRASLARTLAAAFVAVVHVVIPAPVDGYVSSHLSGVLLPHSSAHGPDLLDAGLNRKGLIVLHTPHYPAATNIALNRALRGLNAPNFVWILHTGQSPPHVSCIDEQTIVLTDPKGGWPTGGFSVQFRNTTSKPFAVGDTVQTLDYAATVTEVDDGRAIAVRFRFRAALDHESFVWTTWGMDEFMSTGPSEFCGRR